MRIVIFGAGNVATHLALALDKRHEIVQIVSRTHQHASQLAKRLSHAAEATTDIGQVKTDADIYIISVNDDSIAEIVSNTPDSGLWLHTSGSVGIETFAKHKRRYGVLYPLQTFSQEVALDMSQVPLFIEGNNDDTVNETTRLAQSVSSHIYLADSTQRRQLHIAAVFACNFANRLWAISDTILRDAGYDFNVLSPLLQATLDKAALTGPLAGQTGPARRGDKHIIESHLKSLDGENADIYRLISKSIFNQYNEQN